MQMRKFGVKFQRIDIILISHMHGDHYFGLIGLLNTMHLLGRVTPLQIFGPPELEAIVVSQQAAGRGQLGFDLTFHVISPDSAGVIFSDDKLRISTIPLVHKIPTCGFVIQEEPGELALDVERAIADKIPIAYYHKFKKREDVVSESGEYYAYKDYTLPERDIRKYAFCSDTAYSEELIPFIKGVDLLYHEATFTEKFKDRAKATKHSTAEQAAQIAQLAGVKRLIMGHLSARFESGDTHLLEARRVFQNSTVVEDGDKYLL